jgi:hypothetical protein
MYGGFHLQQTGSARRRVPRRAVDGGVLTLVGERHGLVVGPTSHCGPRLPGGPLRPMKWVMTIETWY